MFMVHMHPAFRRTGSGAAKPRSPWLRAAVVKPRAHVLTQLSQAMEAAHNPTRKSSQGPDNPRVGWIRKENQDL